MIVIDTNALVALVDSRDALHATAVGDLKNLLDSDIYLVPPVLVEACFVLAHPMHRKRLAALIERLGLTPWPEAETDQFLAQVFAWLAKYADHDPDWTDGHLAVLSGRNKRLKIWTYDSEFRTIWRRPDGTKIPMAVKAS